MIWQDILIERPVTDDELAAALAGAFTVPAASIAIIDPIETVDVASIAILCERWPIEGDFTLHVHVFIRADDAKATIETLGDIELVGRIAQYLHTACFISDDDINPFTGRLIRSPYDVHPTRLDPAAEDEGVFRLASVAAHVK